MIHLKNGGKLCNRELFIVQEKPSIFYRKMSKLNQKIVLFIEPAMAACAKPSKIGNLFMNRFAIDEDAKNEILKIYQLKYNSIALYRGRLTLEEGLGLINYRIAYDS